MKSPHEPCPDCGRDTDHCICGIDIEIKGEVRSGMSFSAATFKQQFQRAYE